MMEVIPQAVVAAPVYHVSVLSNISVHLPTGYQCVRALNTGIAGDVESAQGFVL